MASVTKINLDGTAYDIADNTARTTATSAKNTADAAKTAAAAAQSAADTAQSGATTIAAKAVRVTYNSGETSIVVTTGIPLN